MVYRRISQCIKNKTYCKTVIYCGLLQFFALTGISSESPPIWGIDSRLSILQEDAIFEKLLKQSQDSNIGWYREPVITRNDALTRQRLKHMRDRGCHILSMFPWKSSNELTLHAGNLNTELNTVYLQARALARQNQFLIQAWELGNEPDTSFIPALPDQYAAWAKAVYLGLKDGAPQTKILSGAMGLPPGNYLEQIAENGAFWYADAYNQHYYGHPEQFTAMFKLLDEKLVSYASRGLSPNGYLPVWVTECGYRASPPDRDLHSAYQRQRQAEAIGGYADAAINSRIAVFMPYCLHYNYAFALWDNTTQKPFDAWHQYAARTSRPLANFPSAPKLFQSPDTPPPVVVAQWRPNLEQCQPHKLSATYRFIPDNQSNTMSMTGTVRLYNFSDQQQSGSLTLETSDVLQSDLANTSLTIAPNSYQDVRVTLSSTSSGYFRAPVSIRFLATSSQAKPSRLFFQLESPRTLDRFVPVTLQGALPLTFSGRLLSILPFFDPHAPGHYHFSFLDRDENIQISSSTGPWLGINQVRVTAPPDHPTSHTSRSLNIPWLFTLTSDEPHLSRPPTAITHIQGLPSSGFIRLRTTRPMEHGFATRVDIIDTHQRRFSQYEWFGMERGRLNTEIWLNLDDFHTFGWGKFSAKPFNPAEAREIQLRLQFGRANVPIPFQIDFMRPIHLN